MKAIFLIAIVSLGVWASYTGLPTERFFVLCALLTVFPVLIFLKRNLLAGLILWFLLVMFGEVIGNIQVPLLPDWPPQRILWVSIFFIFLLELALGQRKIAFGITKIEIAMLLLCVYIISSTIISGTFYKEGQGPFLNTFLSAYLLPFSMFFLARNIIDGEKEIKKVFIFFSIIGLYLGITGVFEYFQIRELVFPRYIMHPYMGIHFGHARGPFLSAAVNGAILGMIFYMTIHLLFNSNKKWMKFFLSITVLFLMITLLFTLNRASWLGFLLSSLVVPIFFPRMRKILLISIFAVTLVFTFTKTGLIGKQHVETRVTEKVRERATAMSSVYDRMNLYGTAWRMFIEKPIFGFGFNTFMEYSPKYVRPMEGIPFLGWEDQIGLHDTWVGIIVEQGLVGFGLFIFIVFNITKAGLDLYQKLPPRSFLSRELAAVFFGMSIVFFVGFQFSDSRFFIFPNSLYFLIAGIVVGLSQRVQINNSKT